MSEAHAATLPSLTVGDTTVWEGDAGTLVVSVPVDLSAPSLTKVTVKYAVASDSATAGSDFVAKTGSLAFAAGTATKVVTVKVDGDTTPEPDEHIAITLSKPVGATLAKANGGVTIMDDDSDGVSSSIQVNVGDVSVVEANYGYHVASIPITLSRPAPSAIKISYALQCGSAADGSDFAMASTGTLTFAKNATEKNLSFSVVADTVPETLVKSIVQSVQVVKGPAVVGAQVGEGTIVDNDSGSVSGGGGAGALTPGEIRRVSVASDGTEATPVQAFCGLNQSQLAGSQQEAMSADGRYVAFVSDAGNLVPDDGNFDSDVFVHDVVNGTTERVSVQNDGSEFPASYSINEWQTANDHPAISADGRYVTFTHEEDGELYLRDRIAHTTELISVLPNGQPAGERARYSSISADGRYVAFDTSASGLDPSAPPLPLNGLGLYVRDRQLGTTKLVRAYGAEQPGSEANDYGGMALSGNGRYLAFNDFDPTVVPGDTNGCVDTFETDLVTGTTQRVSVDSTGAQQAGNEYNACSYFRPLISSDGRYVGFTSSSTSLGATSVRADHAYVHDGVTGTTDLVDNASDVNPQQPDAILYGMSDDARYVAYECGCGDVIAENGISLDLVTMWTDRVTGDIKEVGVQSDGTPPIDEDTGWFSFTIAMGGLSSDGQVVAFESHATNIVPDDTNGVWDVFVERMG